MQLPSGRAQILAHENRGLRVVVIARSWLISQRGIEPLRRNHFIGGIQVEPLISTLARVFLQVLIESSRNSVPSMLRPDVQTFDLSAVREFRQRSQGDASNRGVSYSG